VAWKERGGEKTHVALCGVPVALVAGVISLFSVAWRRAAATVAYLRAGITVKHNRCLGALVARWLEGG